MNLTAQLNAIAEEFQHITEANEQLRAENNRLRSERYKDEELARAKKDIDELRERCRHYGIPPYCWTNLMKWWEEHEQKHRGIHGYSIEIQELAVATSYTVKCHCGEEHTEYY